MTRDAHAPVYGIIGVGAIAAAIVRGLCRDADPAPAILLSPRNATLARDLAAEFPSVTVAASNQAVVDGASLVVLSVRPQDAGTVLPELRFREAQSIVSVMAGVPLDTLNPLVAPALDISRAVPLPAVERREGATPDLPGHARRHGPVRPARQHGRARERGCVRGDLGVVGDDRRAFRLSRCDRPLARRQDGPRRGRPAPRGRKLRGSRREPARAGARLRAPRPRPRHSRRHQRTVPRFARGGRAARRGRGGARGCLRAARAPAGGVIVAGLTGPKSATPAAPSRWTRRACTSGRPCCRAGSFPPASTACRRPSR